MAIRTVYRIQSLFVGCPFHGTTFTWEGELDWFAFMLTLLLVIDVVALPLVIFYCPGLNPGVRVPDWIRRLGTPIYNVHNWLDSKVGAIHLRRLYGFVKPCILAFIHLLSSAILCGWSSRNGPRSSAHV